MGKAMRSVFVVVVLAFLVFAYTAQINDQEVADLKEDLSVDVPEVKDVNPADCSAVRSSMPSLCNMFGDKYCGAMKAKLEKNCPEETSFLEEDEDSTTDMAPSDNDDYADIGEMQGRRGGGALMTSGSFTMMSSNRAGNSERMLGEADKEEDDEEEKAHDWDIRGNGKCEQEEAWLQTDAEDASSGKCIKFEADTKCSPQCYHKGQSVDETEDAAICSKICRVPGSNGAQCNVIKTVSPIKEGSKTMFLTRSKVMQAGLKLDDLANADPMACAGITTNRRA